MANNWNSEYAILCDLSLAQGREVPAQINNTVAQDEKPPRLVFTEESEVDYFENYVGGGDCNCGPDLASIKHMLGVVDRSSDAECSGDGAVAETNKQTSKPGSGLASSADMFKKKTLSPRSSNSPTHVKSSKQETNLQSSYKQIEPQIYMPSSQANEYYSKYMETSKLLNQVPEDIWSRAERKMRELDAKRRLNDISPSSERSSETHGVGMDFVRLPQHRHNLVEQCVVCEVLCKGYKKDEKIVAVAFEDI